MFQLVGNSEKYILDLRDDYILFNNFNNGTLIVLGDWLNNIGEDQNGNLTGEISETEILNPTDVEKQFVDYFSKYNNPEEIEDIIKFENNRDEYLTNKIDNLNKIIIQGTSLNDVYSLFAFDQNTASIQVKNLSFESTLQAKSNESNIIDFSTIRNRYKFSLPVLDKLSVFYPLDKFNNYSFFKPVLYFNKDIENQYISEIKFEISKTSIDELSSLIYESDNTDDNINKSLSSAIDNIDINVNKLNDIVLSTDFNSTFDEEFNKDNTLINSFEKSLKGEIVSIKENIKKTKDSNPFTDFSIDKVQFEKFILNTSLYIENCLLLVNSIEELKSSANLNIFLKERPDLVNNSIKNTSNNLSNDYIENNYRADLKIIIDKSKLMNDVLTVLKTNLNYNIKEDMLNFIGSSNTSIKQINKKTNYEINNIIFTNNNLYVNSLYLENRNNDPGYITISKNEKGLDLLSSSLFSENVSGTICFWSKLDDDDNNTDITKSNNSTSNIGFFEFKFDNDFKLIINPSLIGTYQIGLDETIISGSAHDLLDINQINFGNALYEVKNDWTFWEINFNTTKIASDKEIGVKMTMYYKNNEGIISGICLTKTDNSESEYIYVDFNIENKKQFELTFGKNSNSNTNYYYNGYLRNLLFFNSSLTNDEINGFFKEGIQPLYDFKEKYNTTVSDLLESGQFFLGLIGSYNNLDININNCVLRYNGKSYEI